jgi:hypothetical protein
LGIDPSLSEAGEVHTDFDQDQGGAAFFLIQEAAQQVLRLNLGCAETMSPILGRLQSPKRRRGQIGEGCHFGKSRHFEVVLRSAEGSLLQTNRSGGGDVVSREPKASGISRLANPCVVN